LLLASEKLLEQPGVMVHVPVVSPITLICFLPEGVACNVSPHVLQKLVEFGEGLLVGRVRRYWSPAAKSVFRSGFGFAWRYRLSALPTRLLLVWVFHSDTNITLVGNPSKFHWTHLPKRGKWQAIE